MTVAELIAELQKLPQDLTVMAAGETAQKVIVEECQGNKYVRIFEPWDMEYTGRFEPTEEESGDDIMETLTNRDAIGYEECFNTGNYDDQDCHFCPHRGECSGYEEDE